MAHYSWHSSVIQTYEITIQKLDNLWSLGTWLGKDFTTSTLQNAARDGKPIVSDDSPDSIAGQFYVFAPGHGFKVESLLDRLREKNEKYIRPLLTSRACVAIVDIGCGGGAASTAVINTILRYRTECLKTLFIGVEVNSHALQLYDWVLQEHSKYAHLDLEVNSRALLKGIPEAFTYIATGIDQIRRLWGLPYLNDLWIIQSNVVRPLADLHKQDIENRNLLKLTAERGLIPDDFGVVEAKGYEQLLQLTQADRMLVLTIATNEDDWRDKAHSLGDSIEQEFEAKDHKIKRIFDAHASDQPLQVDYDNPQGSYWRGRGKITYSASFYADAQYIENHRFLADEDWQQIISSDNLNLAWIRVRAAMMRDSLTDEIALILFESNLRNRLNGLHIELLTYTTRTADFPRFYYEVPKNADAPRQRGLQSIEEEILAVATIQVLGVKTQGAMARNYAYRLNVGNKSELLYRPWYRAYRKYSDMIRKSIKGQDENTLVLRTDIQKFFNSIPQNKLLEATLEQFQARRNLRIEWLLRQLIVREIKDHESSLGIMQGPSVSGFIANLYLLSVDQKFSDDRPDNALFFRYVDDMVIVVPDPSRLEGVKNDLQDQIEELQLTLSEDKTEELRQQEGLNEFQRAPELDKLDEEFRNITAGLYFADRPYQSQAREMNNGDWWRWIEQYQRCLDMLGVFVEKTRLSRKVWQYINGALAPNTRRDMPDFESTENGNIWAEQYINKNPVWMNEYIAIKTKLSDQLKEYWSKWQKTSNDKQRKAIQRQITFALTRLAVLGYQDVVNEIVEMFCTDPYVIKGHRSVLEHLALQQNVEALWEIWGCIQNADIPGVAYIRAMLLRAVRFLNPVMTWETDFLLNYALQEQATEYIELLMATESLLLIGYKPAKAECEALMRRGIELVEASPQVARNFAMLAGQSRHNLDLSLLNEYLEDVYSFAQSETWEKSREEPEPEEIRQTYYHSRYPDGPDEFEGDYF